MKILVVSRDTASNEYIKLFVKSIGGFSDVKCSVQDFFHSNEFFDIIHFQWPEELFGWKKEVSLEEVELVKVRLEYWKNLGTKLVLTLHNESPHVSKESLNELYNLMIPSVHAIHHLGEFSREKYAQKFPKISHSIINHGLYNYLNTPSREEARTYFGFNKEDKIVLVFGSQRSFEEQLIVWNCYKGSRGKRVKFLVTRWSEAQLPSIKKSPFARLFAEWIRLRVNHSPNFFLFNNFVDDALIPYFFKSCDLVLLPRVKSLNSGVVFQAMTYGKYIIGPNVGNIQEILKRHDFGVFDAHEPNSAMKELRRVINCSRFEVNTGEFQCYEWNEIGEKYSTFYKNLIST